MYLDDKYNRVSRNTINICPYSFTLPLSLYWLKTVQKFKATLSDNASLNLLFKVNLLLFIAKCFCSLPKIQISSWHRIN